MHVSKSVDCSLNSDLVAPVPQLLFLLVSAEGWISAAAFDRFSWLLDCANNNSLPLHFYCFERKGTGRKLRITVQFRWQPTKLARPYSRQLLLAVL